MRRVDPVAYEAYLKVNLWSQTKKIVTKAVPQPHGFPHHCGDYLKAIINNDNAPDAMKYLVMSLPEPGEVA